MNKNICLFWHNQLISLFGAQVGLITQILWMKRQTDSAVLVGILLASSSLATLCCGPFGGALADRLPRKWIFVICDLFASVVIAGVGWALWWTTLSSRMMIILLLAGSWLIAALQAVYRPTMLAALPDLWPNEQLTQGNAWFEGTRELSMVAGQAIGGLLFFPLGAPLLFCMNGVAYFYAATCGLWVTFPEQSASAVARPDESPPKTNFLRDVLDGFRLVWRDVGLRALLSCAVALNLLLSPFPVLLPFYLNDQLHCHLSWVGYVFAALSVGMVIGFVVAARVPLAGTRKSVALIAALGMIAAAVTLLHVLTQVAWVCGAVALLGMQIGFVNVHVLTIFQQQAPADYRGRVMATLYTLAACLTPLSMAAAGFLADAIGHDQVGKIFQGMGILLFVTTILAVCNRHFRAFLMR